MATVIRRNIRATPYRTGSETWAVICDLVAAKGTGARSELESVAGTAEQLICSEAPKSSPMVFYGSGPRLRVYCLYDDEAVSDDEAKEDALSFNPTDNNWRLSLPAEADDVNWANVELNKKSKRISAHDKDESLVEDEEPTSSSKTAPSVDVGAFLRS